MKALTVEEVMETLKNMNPKAIFEFIDDSGERLVITDLEDYEEDVVSITLSNKK